MSGVNDDCYVHYYIQQQNTSNHLGDILVFTCSCVETMADGLQPTQCGSKVKHQCQLTIVGGALACVMSHSQGSENGLILERGHNLSIFLKNHWVDFYHYRVVVYTHCQHTFQFKHHVKVNFASDDPFKFWCLYHVKFKAYNKTFTFQY